MVDLISIKSPFKETGSRGMETLDHAGKNSVPVTVLFASSEHGKQLVVEAAADSRSDWYRAALTQRSNIMHHKREKVSGETSKCSRPHQRLLFFLSLVPI